MSGWSVEKGMQEKDFQYNIQHIIEVCLLDYYFYSHGTDRISLICTWVHTFTCYILLASLNYDLLSPAKSLFCCRIDPISLQSLITL